MNNSEQLINNISKGKNLSFEESKTIFLSIMNGKMSESLIYNFLTYLSAKGETSDEIAGGVYVLREKALKVKTSDEMFSAVKKSLPVDVAVCTAAVSDFKPSTFQKNKIKKNKSKERIDLDGTIDILNYIGKNNHTRRSFYTL